MNPKYILLSCILLIIVFGKLTANGEHYDVNSERENIMAKLKTAETPADSLKLLYDLFDVETRAHKRAVGLEIYDLAVREERYDEALDIIRNIAGFVTDEDALTRLIPKIKALPESRAQQETLLFIDMKKMSGKSRRMNYTEQHDYIQKYVDNLRKSNNASPSFDEKIKDLYTVTAMLRNDVHLDMIKEYVDSLMEMANEPDLTLDAIPNLIYSEAANIYTDARLHSNAVRADRQLLKVINNLDSKYREMGRKYRNYDISRYICYRRMLRNYKGLAPGEADRIYANILELAAVNQEVGQDFHKYRLPHTYYLMAKGNHKQAIPEIKKRLTEENALPVRRQLITMLTEAATAVGDTATLVDALRQKNELLRSMNANDAEARYKELQTAYDISYLRNTQNVMRLQMAEKEAKAMKTSMIIMGVLWVLILMLLGLILYFWSRYRKNAQYLHNFAREIRIQRDDLKRLLYYDSARGGDDENYEGLNRINYQAPLFTPAENFIVGVVSDIVYVSAMGRNERLHHITDAHLPEIIAGLREFADKEIKKDNEDINIVIEKTPENITMITDPECLEYMLNHLLLFGAEHCGKDGTVTFRTFVDLNTGEISFRCSHSGRLIEPGREESLFRNIMNLQFLKKRKDAVLFICRLNAFLLHCRLFYNPHIEREAELYFNVPIKLTE